MYSAVDPLDNCNTRGREDRLILINNRGTITEEPLSLTCFQVESAWF